MRTSARLFPIWSDDRSADYPHRRVYPRESSYLHPLSRYIECQPLEEPFADPPVRQAPALDVVCAKTLGRNRAMKYPAHLLIQGPATPQAAVVGGKSWEA